MQVRPADVGARDADDRVGRFLDGRVRHVLYGHLPSALPGDCSHGSSSQSSVIGRMPTAGDAKPHLIRAVAHSTRQDGRMAAGGLVLELRVHGVSGTSPEALLGCPTEFLEAGRRRQDCGLLPPAALDRRRHVAASGVWRKVPEAYSWGGLTSGPASRAFWLLFLPFIFINLAHWMLPPATSSVAPRRSRSACCDSSRCRFTVTLMLASAVAVMDVMVWQCVGLDYCGARYGAVDVPGVAAAGGAGRAQRAAARRGDRGALAAGTGECRGPLASRRIPR